MFRTCDLCLRRANAPRPQLPEQRILSIARIGCCKSLATTPQPAFLLRATFPCEIALWLFYDVDRRRKLKGWARTLMNHHQIPRLDCDQRCDGNLPFASLLMALLSGPLGGTGFCRRRNPLFPLAQTVGFGPGRSKMLHLSMRID